MKTLMNLVFAGGIKKGFLRLLKFLNHLKIKLIKYENPEKGTLGKNEISDKMTYTL